MVNFIGRYICPKCMDISDTAIDKTIMTTAFKLNEVLTVIDYTEDSRAYKCTLNCGHTFDELAVSTHFEYKDYGDKNPTLFLPKFVMDLPEDRQQPYIIVINNYIDSLLDNQ